MQNVSYNSGAEHVGSILHHLNNNLLKIIEFLMQTFLKSLQVAQTTF